MILSALAGMGAVNLCHPLDVIRIQMQIHTTTTTTRSHHSQYRPFVSSSSLSVWQTACTIYQRAGIRHGLYAGISAAYVRQILYGSCRMGIYSHLIMTAQQQQQQHNQQDNGSSSSHHPTSSVSLVQKLQMGCIAGSIGSFLGTPADVALVRMSSHSVNGGSITTTQRHRSYSSVVHCWKHIIQEEGGIRQLWRGATPTVLRATLLSACSLGITSEVKERLSASHYFSGNDEHHPGPWLDGYPVLFVATTISSFFANLVSTPFDVMKSRMQQQHNTAYNKVNLWDCFVQSIRAEGIQVLWKGFTPAFLKLAPYSIISLTLLDKLTRAWTGHDAL